MYLITYIKSDGKEIILTVNNNRQMKDMVISLTDRLTIGTVLSFNVERLK